MSHPLAQADARALFDYLVHLGACVPAPGQRTSSPLPALPCSPTPLAGSETLTSPVPGVLVFLAEPGAVLQNGEAVAEVIDPITGRVTVIRTQVSGLFYARVRERFVLAGEEVGKVAGAVPFRTGALLGF